MKLNKEDLIKQSQILDYLALNLELLFSIFFYRFLSFQNYQVHLRELLSQFHHHEDNNQLLQSLPVYNLFQFNTYILKPNQKL